MMRRFVNFLAIFKAS